MHWGIKNVQKRAKTCKNVQKRAQLAKTIRNDQKRSKTCRTRKNVQKRAKTCKKRAGTMHKTIKTIKTIKNDQKRAKTCKNVQKRTKLAETCKNVQKRAKTQKGVWTMTKSRALRVFAFVLSFYEADSQCGSKRHNACLDRGLLILKQPGIAILRERMPMLAKVNRRTRDNMVMTFIL
jgi:hypothetical protein